MKAKGMKVTVSIFVFLFPLLACAQLTVTVSAPKVGAQKAVVHLVMKNGFSERIESARAVVFLLDEQGKMVGQSTKWVIGGSEQKQGLSAGATNVFNFVITADKPLTSTNLTAKVSFNRVVLAGGKLPNLKKEVLIQSASK